jgi:hypothetical protein
MAYSDLIAIGGKSPLDRTMDSIMAKVKDQKE